MHRSIAAYVEETLKAFLGEDKMGGDRVADYDLVLSSLYTMILMMGGNARANGSIFTNSDIGDGKGYLYHYIKDLTLGLLVKTSPRDVLFHFPAHVKHFLLQPVEFGKGDKKETLALIHAIAKRNYVAMEKKRKDHGTNIQTVHRVIYRSILDFVEHPDEKPELSSNQDNEKFQSLEGVVKEAFGTDFHAVPVVSSLDQHGKTRINVVVEYRNVRGVKGDAVLSSVSEEFGRMIKRQKHWLSVDDQTIDTDVIRAARERSSDKGNRFSRFLSGSEKRGFSIIKANAMNEAKNLESILRN